MKGKACCSIVWLGLAVVACAMTARGAFAAGTIHVPTMPESEWLDTEVSTNISFNASGRELRKIDVDMQFAGTPTNNVQIAFGRDADHDGNLSDEEAQLVFGWKGGRRFLSFPFEERRVLEDVPPGASEMHSLRLFVQFNGRQEPTSFFVRDAAQPCFADLAAGSREWSGVASWNICKVTRRGADEAFENVEVGVASTSFEISIR